MRNVALTFRSMMAFLDFQLHVQSRDYKINRKRLTITGAFLEKEIQLARKLFGAQDFSLS